MLRIKELLISFKDPNFFTRISAKTKTRVQLIWNNYFLDQYLRLLFFFLCFMASTIYPRSSTNPFLYFSPCVTMSIASNYLNVTQLRKRREIKKKTNRTRFVVKFVIDRPSDRRLNARRLVYPSLEILHNYSKVEISKSIYRNSVFGSRYPGREHISPSLAK